MPATEPPVVLPEAALTLPGTPTIKRRLAVMVYEFFLLFAVEMLAVLLYLLVTGNRQDPLFQHGLKVYLFVITGLYLPGHARLPWRVAIVRYLTAWGWFAPALIVCAAFGLHAKADIAIALALGVAAWAATAWLDPDRQFLHDRLAGTRQIGLPKPVSGEGQGKGNGKGKLP
jgi:uncharacterized RDD family membrane protein YckC